MPRAQHPCARPLHNSVRRGRGISLGQLHARGEESATTGEKPRNAKRTNTPFPYVSRILSSPRRMAASTAACLLDSAPLSHAWLACRLHTRRCMCQILLLLPCLLSVCARTVCPRAMQQAHHRYVGGGFRHREAGDALRYAAGQCSNRLRIPETRGLSLTDFTHAPQDFPAYELKFNLPGRGCILRFDHRIEWCALSLFFASADFTPSACRGSGRDTWRAAHFLLWTYVQANC